MSTDSEIAAAPEKAHRLELARRIFRERFAQCFWSSDPAMKIEERHLPFIIRGLREHGGHSGYQLAAEIAKALPEEVA